MHTRSSSSDVIALNGIVSGEQLLVGRSSLTLFAGGVLITCLLTSLPCINNGVVTLERKNTWQYCTVR